MGKLMGLLRLPLLLIGLYRAARRWPWPFVAVVAIPFLAFWIYWGNGSSGFPREGLQAWVLAVLAGLRNRRRRRPDGSPDQRHALHTRLE